MGLADWWLHRGQPTTAVIISQGRVYEINYNVHDGKNDCDDTEDGDKWQAAEARKMTRSKSARRNSRQNAALLAHGCPQVSTKGLFQQAFVAKLFPKISGFQIQRPESPTTSPWMSKAEPNEGRRSRFRGFFSRSTPVEEDTKAFETQLIPEKWLSSEASLRFQDEVNSVMSNGVSQFQITSEGCGGAYFLHEQSSRKKSAPLGIFKPRDEEYMAPKNPRGYVKENAVVGETEHPVNKGFRVGNGALRERAAYLLDETYGNFSGVPVTTVMTLAVHGEEKEGSMQRFVPSECSAEDMGTLKFAIPEVHKIGILDVRLFNTDRHAGNILLSSRPDEQTYQMTPIDHGFCLPSYKHLDSATFDWLHWPQAQFPFTGAELDHIAALDIDRDATILRSLEIEEECITTLRLSTAMLKIGADAGYSLFDIANCLQREGDFTSPSTLEDLVANAAATVVNQTGLSEQDGGLEFYDALVAEVEQAALKMFDDKPKKKVRSISCFS
jgi:hypothetical protein